MSSQTAEAITKFLEEEAAWKARCLAAVSERCSVATTPFEEAARLSRHVGFSTGTIERHAETERWRDAGTTWREVLIIVEIDKKSRQMISKTPISIADSRRRWPPPVATPTAPLSLEQRIERLERIAKRNGDLQDGPVIAGNIVFDSVDQRNVAAVFHFDDGDRFLGNIGAGEVVIVGIAIAPDETAAGILVAGDRLDADADLAVAETDAVENQRSMVGRGIAG